MQKVSVFPISNSSKDVAGSLQLSGAAKARWGWFAKRALDLLLVTIGLILISPFLVSIVAFLMALQGRPIFIRHERVGHRGISFRCFKFRTMVVDSSAVLRAHLEANAGAREEWEASRKLKDDPRVTPIGRVMRRLSIDELPQLMNIIRGEMSLVGPRPIVSDEIPLYGALFETYAKVKPGLTGSWQISGRNDVSYAKRVEMDADYVDNWSLRRDVVIIAKTIPAVLGAKGCY